MKHISFKIFTILLSLILFLFVITPISKAQTCGSITGNPLDPCIDINYNPINPFVRCNFNANVCCSSQNDCNLINPNPPTITPNPALSSTPGPSLTPACINPPNTSSQNCGYVGSPDPLYCSTQCLDSNYNSIWPYEVCPQGSPYGCCRSGLCPTPPIQQGSCYEHVHCSTICSSGGGECIFSTGECVCDEPQPIPPYDLCANISSNEQAACNSCVGPDKTEGIYTAIGCIPTNPSSFTRQFARLIIGIAGGIALLLMLIGAFFVTTAGGDPKKVESGKSTFTSAIIGLLVVIFSAVLLQFIGIEILQLPGL